MPKLSEPWQEKVETDQYTLYLGDCLEVLPTLATESIDAVVTDPPFGINFKYKTYKDVIEGYGPWLWSVIQEAERKCRAGSPIFMWQAMLNVRRFAEWYPRDWRIFAGCKNFVQMRPTAMQYAFDPVLVWWTEGEAYSLGTSSRDYHVGNTNPSSREDVPGHPCPRPLDQVMHILEQWVRPNGTVLDCFMGSGTTGDACINLNRKFIGIESDPTYFAIAAKRLIEVRLKSPAERALASLKDGTSADLKKFIAKRRAGIRSQG